MLLAIKRSKKPKQKSSKPLKEFTTINSMPPRASTSVIGAPIRTSVLSNTREHESNLKNQISNLKIMVSLRHNRATITNHISLITISCYTVLKRREMPKELERELKAEAKAKGLKGERADAYVYGTLRKTGWVPSTQKNKRRGNGRGKKV